MGNKKKVCASKTNKNMYYSAQSAKKIITKLIF